ncbi:hypothetical protein GGR55DRAFT_676210 [Xylaria sp. FL0064]|nr:hypothetical protein GGR55DRAFT_676210 [Xylaria sp. FL0064]
MQLKSILATLFLASAVATAPVQQDNKGLSGIISSVEGVSTGSGNKDNGNGDGNDNGKGNGNGNKAGNGDGNGNKVGNGNKAGNGNGSGNSASNFLNNIGDVNVGEAGNQVAQVWTDELMHEQAE